MSNNCSKELNVVGDLVEALIWASGSGDFAPEGQASIGWDKLARPAINAGLQLLEEAGLGQPGSSEESEIDEPTTSEQGMTLPVVGSHETNPFPKL